MPTLVLDGRAIAYRVRTSRRAKGIFIRNCLRGGLEVVYPTRLQQPTPESLLRERSAWVLSTTLRFSEARAKQPPRKYRAGEAFLYRGARLKLQLTKRRTCKRAVARLRDGVLAVELPQSASDETQLVRGAIERFYREAARAYLPRRVAELAQRHGFDYEMLRIKNQKTIWGSCSAKRNINLNMRLMMAPDQAIDYVILHELCHLRELNHSRAFWALVEAICPAYREWRAWFKRYGPSLIL